MLFRSNEPFFHLNRFITGHAFVGSYTARFRPDLPTSCPCGAPLQTVEHVIFSCPLYADARRDILQPIDHGSSLPILLNFTQGGAALSRFIQTTRAYMLPRRIWDPGQPRWLIFQLTRLMIPLTYTPRFRLVLRYLPS